MKRWKIQLYDAGTGEIIDDAGGFLIATKDGDSAKETLLTSTGASQANGMALTRGAATFFAADTVTQVDLYIMAPNGQFVVELDVVPGDGFHIAVELKQRNQVMKVPFDIADCTAGTEKDSGYDEPTGAVFVPSGAGVLVTTADAADTVNIGTGEVNPADGGDADGFCSAVSTGSATFVEDNGALLAAAHYSSGDSITYTLSAGSTTAGGFAILPYLLTA